MHTQIKGLGFYGPELLRTLQEVFDSAWQEISSSSHSPSAEDLERSRRDLAEMIILAHKSGLGPEEIKSLRIRQYPRHRASHGRFLGNASWLSA